MIDMVWKNTCCSVQLFVHKFEIYCTVQTTSAMRFNTATLLSKNTFLESPSKFNAHENWLTLWRSGFEIWRFVYVEATTFGTANCLVQWKTTTLHGFSGQKVSNGVSNVVNEPKYKDKNCGVRENWLFCIFSPEQFQSAQVAIARLRMVLNVLAVEIWLGCFPKPAFERGKNALKSQLVHQNTQSNFRNSSQRVPEKCSKIFSRILEGQNSIGIEYGAWQRPGTSSRSVFFSDRSGRVSKKHCNLPPPPEWANFWPSLLHILDRRSLSSSPPSVQS